MADRALAARVAVAGPAAGVALFAAAAVALLAAGGASARTSLPSVASGHRPGPDVLYEAPARVPQLVNERPWRAKPIMVSGTSAYRRGEFIYQDYIYDDHGANGIPDPTDPFNPIEFTFSARKGTLTYPNSGEFANNSADLVELRVKPLARATAFRVTLNSLPPNPERVAFTIALGDSPEAVPWPHAAGVRSPAAHFLTVHGEHAELREASAGATVTPAPRVALVPRRRQFDVRVSRKAWDPRRSTVRMAAGTGIWDPGADRYAQPGRLASANNPGGAAASGAALFNVAFRFDEPLPQISNPPAGNTVVESGIAAREDGAWWRERAQALALADGDISDFSARVNFRKLARRRNDNSQIPRRGFTNRIFASHSNVGQGVDHTRTCLLELGDDCTPRFLGRLQPYTLYVPDRPRPKRGRGLTVLMHGLSANHNEFLGSNHARQLGDRGPGSVVAAPYGRGPDGFWADLAEADVFEMWADIARRFRLDPAYNAVGGYSMGGIGTFRLTTRWPDLFAAGVPVVGIDQGSTRQLASLRNVPIMMWNVLADELVNVLLVGQTRRNLAEAGVRYESWMFAPGGHITLANNDEYGPMAKFLGARRVNRKPAHVTYVVNPANDSERGRAVADHAYWLAGLRVRDKGQIGRIDARSHAFGVGDPEVRPISRGAGTLEGGTHGPLAYEYERREWGGVPKTPRANRLTIDAHNLARAVLDTKRARVGCDVKLEVTTDGPFALRLGGCREAVRRFG